MNEPTIVLFRADRSGPTKGEVTAVFPEHKEGPGLYSCYGHIGQHSSCSRGWYQSTRAAKPEEYADLKTELESYGPPDAHYNLIVRKRWPPGL